MAFSWVHNPSNITLIDDNVYVEMRNNLDSIKEYVDCNQNYVTDYAHNNNSIYSSRDITRKASEDAGQCSNRNNTEHTSLHSNNDSTVYGGDKSSEYSSDNSSDNSSYNNNVDTGNNTTELSGDNGSYRYGYYYYVATGVNYTRFDHKYDSQTDGGHTVYYTSKDLNRDIDDYTQINGAQNSGDQTIVNAIH